MEDLEKFAFKISLGSIKFLEALDWFKMERVLDDI